MSSILARRCDLVDDEVVLFLWKGLGLFFVVVLVFLLYAMSCPFRMPRVILVLSMN